MRQNIIVVDNFYDNPGEVRNFGLNSKFPIDKESTYPGRNSDEFYYSEEIHKKFEFLAKERLTVPIRTDTSVFLLRMIHVNKTFM